MFVVVVAVDVASPLGSAQSLRCQATDHHCFQQGYI
jgi:hypothetical protein